MTPTSPAPATVPVTPDALDALRRAASHYFDLYDDATAEGDHVGTARDLYDVYEHLSSLYRALGGS